MNCDCELDHRKTTVKQGLKERRKVRHLEWCGSCGRTSEVDGPALLTCAKCHNVRYCSRDCQKKHWPSHKTVCAEDNATHFKALVKNLRANVPIQVHLAMCAAIRLGLDKDELNTNTTSTEIALRQRGTTMHVHVGMALKPCNDDDAMRLLAVGPDRFADAHMTGMLQFLSMREHPLDYEAAPDAVRGVQVTQKRLDMLGAIADTSEFIVIVVELVLDNAHLACCLPYMPGSLREALKTKAFADYNPNASIDENVAKTLKHLNDHIRTDTTNVYRLRYPLRKIDKAPLLDAFLTLADIWTPEQKRIVRERVLGKDFPKSPVLGF